MRKAFTLIELMVVIGIILVLIGVVAIGLSQIGENQKAKNTQHVLESLASMHEELKSRTNLRDVQTILVDADVRAVIAPSSQDLFNSPAIVQTQRMMKKMLSVPANKTVMQQLPSDRFLWEVPAGATVSNDLETDGNKLTTPLPLDAWGNPIIYVPPPDTRTGVSIAWDDRYGLDEVYLEQGPASSPPKVLNPRQGWPNKDDFVMLQTFRPFWVSAGPDGFFGKRGDGEPAGDDNIYSFEN